MLSVQFATSRSTVSGGCGTEILTCTLKPNTPSGGDRIGGLFGSGAFDAKPRKPREFGSIGSSAPFVRFPKPNTLPNGPRKPLELKGNPENSTLPGCAFRLHMATRVERAATEESGRSTLPAAPRPPLKNASFSATYER